MKPAPTGEARRDGAHAILKAKRAALVRKAQRALLHFLLSPDDVTADDIRELVPTPANINPVVFGAVPPELVKAGLITANGWRKSARSKAHARTVQVWVLCNRVAATAWLSANPELPSIEGDGLQGVLFDDTTEGSIQ